METTSLRLAGVVALAALAAGCDGATPAAPVVDSGPLFSCATETRAVPYEPNLTRTSTAGTFTAVLVAADPAPPAKGNNTWTVEIRDASQTPVDGLAITPSALMVEHGHSPSVKPRATAVGSGRYTVMPLDLFMAGYWEITLTWQSADGGKETVVFPICIPG